MQITDELTDSLTLKFSQLAREKNKKGEQTLFCNTCMKEKVKANKRAQEKRWSGYEIE